MSVRLPRLRSSALLSILLSLLLHLVLLLAPHLSSNDIRVARRLRLQPQPWFERIRRYAAHGSARQRDLTQRLEAPTFTDWYESSEDGERYGVISPFRPLPLATLSHPFTQRDKRPEYGHVPLARPDLNTLALASAQADIERKEEYLHLELHDIDTTDAESQGNRVAREVVGRAIEVMGGREALRKIHAMHAKIWIQSSADAVRGVIQRVPPYVYPVERWHFSALRPSRIVPIRLEPSVDPAMVNPDYVFRHPPELSAYRALFAQRWRYAQAFGGTYIDVRGIRRNKARLREQGETARWHFIDTFLGEGIRLGYLGAEDFLGETAEVVRVEDHIHGNFKEAFFSRDSGLLVGVREGLTAAEGVRYRHRFHKDPPVWTTVYRRYRPVDGVLAPHILERWKDNHMGVIVHVSMAWNGAQPDEAPPALWDGAEARIPLPAVR